MSSQSGWVFPDERLPRLMSLKIEIKDAIYKASDDKEFKVGDLVLDRQDGNYGTIDQIRKDYAAVRSGSTIELGIPLTNLVKLV